MVSFLRKSNAVETDKIRRSQYVHQLKRWDIRKVNYNRTPGAKTVATSSGKETTPSSSLESRTVDNDSPDQQISEVPDDNPSIVSLAEAHISLPTECQHEEISPNGSTEIFMAVEDAIPEPCLQMDSAIPTTYVLTPEFTIPSDTVIDDGDNRLRSTFQKDIAPMSSKVTLAPSISSTDSSLAAMRRLRDGTKQVAPKGSFINGMHTAGIEDNDSIQVEVGSVWAMESTESVSRSIEGSLDDAAPAILGVGRGWYDSISSIERFEWVSTRSVEFEDVDRKPVTNNEISEPRYFQELSPNMSEDEEGYRAEAESAAEEDFASSARAGPRISFEETHLYSRLRRTPDVMTLGSHDAAFTRSERSAGHYRRGISVSAAFGKIQASRKIRRQASPLLDRMSRVFAKLRITGRKKENG